MREAARTGVGVMKAAIVVGVDVDEIDEDGGDSWIRYDGDEVTVINTGVKYVLYKRICSMIVGYLAVDGNTGISYRNTGISYGNTGMGLHLIGCRRMATVLYAV